MSDTRRAFLLKLAGIGVWSASGIPLPVTVKKMASMCEGDYLTHVVMPDGVWLYAAWGTDARGMIDKPEKGTEYIDIHTGKLYTFTGEKWEEDASQTDRAQHPGPAV